MAGYQFVPSLFLHFGDARVVTKAKKRLHLLRNARYARRDVS